MTMGKPQMEVFDRLVLDAVAKGARLLWGGKPNDTLSAESESFYLPTLLVDVTNEMQITQNEVFGPIMVIMKASSDEHAISIVCICTLSLL